MRVTFNEHNLSIIGTFVEHNRKIFGAVQHSIIGYFLSIIGSALPGCLSPGDHKQSQKVCLPIKNLKALSVLILFMHLPAMN